MFNDKKPNRAPKLIKFDTVVNDNDRERATDTIPTSIMATHGVL